MRLKTLTAYNFKTVKSAIIIFYSFFIAGTLLGSILNSAFAGDGVVMGVSDVTSEGVTQTWSSSIIAFIIFMLVSSLIGSQKETRFLITRSVSRKEIFLSNAIFIVPLAAIMSILQLIAIVIDATLRTIFSGDSFRGLKLDFQTMQAPNMNNFLVFFTVSFSILLCFGALSYLLGSCLARWKIPTIGVLAVGFIVFIACITIQDFGRWVIDAFNFMFTDEKSGLWIALKQIVAAIIIILISFPVMRRITAAKQTQ